MSRVPTATALCGLSTSDISEATDVAPADVHVVAPATLPNPNWLVPGQPSAGQQAFGDALLDANSFVLLPSTVSRHSWNLIFLKATAVGSHTLRSQEAFVLDPRLHPPSR